MVTNARKELINILDNIEKTPSDISWMLVYKATYSEVSDAFTTIDQLNFNYDSGYGGQELFGTVYFNDGTWLDRGEYDGSEWWEHMTPPILEQWKKQYEYDRELRQ